MAATVHQLPVLHDKNGVGIDQGGQSVGNHDHRTADRNAGQVVDKDGLTLRVE